MLVLFRVKFVENQILKKRLILLSVKKNGWLLIRDLLVSELVNNAAVSTKQQAEFTMVYVVKWAQGSKFDLAKSQVKVNRARLRKIGIDIAKPCFFELPVYYRFDSSE